MSKPQKKVIGGYIIGIIPVLILFMSAYFKFAPSQEAIDGMAKSGFPAQIAAQVGVVEVLCTVLFLIPQTAVLGAILLTGYLGGATFAHVRMLEPFFLPIIFGVMIWGSLWLRDERIRNLIPLKKNQ